MRPVIANSYGLMTNFIVNNMCIKASVIQRYDIKASIKIPREQHILYIQKSCLFIVLYSNFSSACQKNVFLMERVGGECIINF